MSAKELMPLKVTMIEISIKKLSSLRMNKRLNNIYLCLSRLRLLREREGDQQALGNILHRMRD